MFDKDLGVSCLKRILHFHPDMKLAKYEMQHDRISFGKRNYLFEDKAQKIFDYDILQIHILANIEFQ